MANIAKDLKILREPSNIKNVFLASSPYVLRKVFMIDPVIQRLIKSGEKVVPYINDEVKKNDQISDITLAAFVFILENVKVDAVIKIFGDSFKKAIKIPGPFFVHFAAHAIRANLHLSLRTPEFVYTRDELNEILNSIH